jgi:hypothetical protein
MEIKGKNEGSEKVTRKESRPNPDFFVLRPLLKL